MDPVRIWSSYTKSASAKRRVSGSATTASTQGVGNVKSLKSCDLFNLIINYPLMDKEIEVAVQPIKSEEHAIEVAAVYIREHPEVE